MLSSRQHSVHAFASSTVQMVHPHIGHAGRFLLVFYGIDGGWSLMLKTRQESNTATLPTTARLRRSVVGGC